MRQRFLASNGLDHWSRATTARVEEGHQKSEGKLMQRCECYDDLESLTRAQRHAYHAYLRGECMETQGWSRPTYYRYRKALLKVGVDIFQPVNVRALPVRPRVIELRAPSIPEFYHRAPGTLLAA